MKTYETRPGDTPSVIAKEQLGDRDLWADIVVLNAGKCGIMGPHDWYRVGTFLRLPEGAMSAIDDMKLKFTSGNCIPVDRTIVTRDELLAVVAELEALRQERDGLLADAVRLSWLVRKISGKELRSVGVIYSAGETTIRHAIDAAMAKEQGDE